MTINWFWRIVWAFVAGIGVWGGLAVSWPDLFGTYTYTRFGTSKQASTHLLNEIAGIGVWAFILFGLPLMVRGWRRINITAKGFDRKFTFYMSVLVFNKARIQFKFKAAGFAWYGGLIGLTYGYSLAPLYLEHYGLTHEFLAWQIATALVLTLYATWRPQVWKVSEQEQYVDWMMKDRS